LLKKRYFSQCSCLYFFQYSQNIRLIKILAFYFSAASGGEFPSQSD
jgi:hypothetical protein